MYYDCIIDDNMWFVKQRKGPCPFSPFQPASFPERGYDVQGVMNEIMNYNLKVENVSEAMTETVSVIVDIAGKSIRTLFNGLSFLKLPEEIRTAIVPPLLGLNRTEGTGRTGAGGRKVFS